MWSFDVCIKETVYWTELANRNTIYYSRQYYPPSWADTWNFKGADIESTYTWQWGTSPQLGLTSSGILDDRIHSRLALTFLIDHSHKIALPTSVNLFTLNFERLGDDFRNRSILRTCQTQGGWCTTFAWKCHVSTRVVLMLGSSIRRKLSLGMGTEEVLILDGYDQQRGQRGRKH